MIPNIPIKRLPHGAGLPLPAYETALAAGMDLRCAAPEGEPIVLQPGERFPVPTGLPSTSITAATWTPVPQKNTSSAM